MSFTDIFKKIFGTKAERDLKQLRPILDKVLVAYDSIDKLSDDELRAKSEELKARIRERTAAKKDEQARGFYEWCQGEDWETVIDLDTEVLVNYEKNHVRLFRSPIEMIQVPLLITVSRKDEMLANDMEAECRRLHEKNPYVSYKIYDSGAHPLILSRAEEMAELVREFLKNAV